MSHGYENCYLYSSLHAGSSSSGFTAAQITDKAPTPVKSATTSSPSASSTHPAQAHASNTPTPDDDSSVNPGLIAGPVVGAIVLIGLLIAIFWIWRRRGLSQRTTTRAPPPTEASAGADHAGAVRYGYLPSNGQVAPGQDAMHVYKDNPYATAAPIQTPITPYGQTPITPYGQPPPPALYTPAPVVAPAPAANYYMGAEKDSWPIYQLPSPEDGGGGAPIGKPHPAVMRQEREPAELDARASMTRNTSVGSRERSTSFGSGKSPDSKHGPWRVGE
jgi:hypothetical protein